MVFWLKLFADRTVDLMAGILDTRHIRKFTFAQVLNLFLDENIYTISYSIACNP